jgi:hypothetical protein
MAEKKKVLERDVMLLSPLHWVVAETSIPMTGSLRKFNGKQVKHNPEMKKVVKRLIEFFKDELPQA